jgi:twitching motility protein PilT
MRDLETIALALTAAETGHLVFATLHTNGASKTVDRIIDVFPTGQQAQIRTMLSESLRGVVAQSLLPSADGQGRIPVTEILVNALSVSNLIREGKTFQINSVMQTGRGYGMCTFDASVNELIRKNLITREVGNNFIARRTRGMTSNSGGAVATEQRQRLHG